MCQISGCRKKEQFHFTAIFLSMRNKINKYINNTSIPHTRIKEKQTLMHQKRRNNDLLCRTSKRGNQTPSREKPPAHASDGAKAPHFHHGFTQLLPSESPTTHRTTNSHRSMIIMAWSVTWLAATSTARWGPRCRCYGRREFGGGGRKQKSALDENVKRERSRWCRRVKMGACSSGPLGCFWYFFVFLATPGSSLGTGANKSQPTSARVLSKMTCFFLVPIKWQF